MKKRSAFIILAALSLPGGLMPTAQARSLVFGPEFFDNDQGDADKTVRRFPVNDAGRKFILSVQGGGRSKNGIGKGVVEINGESVASLDLGDQFNMLMRPVSLQKTNNLSVAMTHAADALIMVSIMSPEEHKSAVTVPPIGGEAELPGFAVIAFPSGSFEQPRKVMISAAASDNDIFGDHETGIRLPYEIRINTGDSAPEKDMRADLNLPHSFYASPFQIHIFARMQDNPATTSDHGRFVMLTSSVKSATMTASTVFPKQTFSTRFSKDGTFEAVLTVGLIPF